MYKADPEGKEVVGAILARMRFFVDLVPRSFTETPGNAALFRPEVGMSGR